MCSELRGGEVDCVEQGGSGGWLGCLPVIGRDGDQRFDAALKVDL